jgi:hypothetical protein
MKAQRKRKAGRPPGRAPRPHIPIDGDTLVPKVEAAKELGVVPRTLTRMRAETLYFGGVAYVNREKLAQQIADSASVPKKRRGAWR